MPLVTAAIPRRFPNQIDDLRPKVVQDPIGIDEKSLSDLKISGATNIWRSMLALGKIGGDKWFDMATQACRLLKMNVQRRATAKRCC